MRHARGWRDASAVLAVIALMTTCTDRGREPLGVSFNFVSAIGTINNPTPINADPSLTHRLPLNIAYDPTVSPTDGKVEFNDACLVAFPSGTPTGTGVYKPFLRVNVNKTWFQAWNTSTRPLPAPPPLNDAEDKSFTTDIRLSEIPKIKTGFLDCSGGPYRELRMDINQANPLELGINQIRIYIHQNPNGGVVGLGTLVWSLDQWSGAPPDPSDATDDWTIISKKLAPGSGRDDLILLIPETNIPPQALADCPYDAGLGMTCNWYMTFFTEAGSSATGGQNPHDPDLVQSSGFEEWGVLKRPVPPKLTLVKHVMNDDGGNAFADDWTLSATGTTSSFSGSPLPADAPAGSVGPNDVDPDVEYTLSESGPSGYAIAIDWQCTITPAAGAQTATGVFTAANPAADPPTPATIKLGAGESATCTITNDDVAPELTLVKNVVNDNGGTALASAWTLTANDGGAGTDLSGTGTQATTGNPPPNQATLTGSVTANATYPLSESGPSGYAISIDWQCTITPATGAQTATGVFTAANPAADPPTPATIMLGAGESATCTITNDDNPPELTLVKNVTNDNGGTELASAWTLTADDGGDGVDLTGTGTQATTGNPIPNQATLTGPVTANKTYMLSESGPSGYTVPGDKDWACTLTPATPGGQVTGSFTPRAGNTPPSVTLGEGESATCTITNDDNPPELTLVKNVTNDNGGTELASAWTLTADDGGDGVDLTGTGTQATTGNPPPNQATLTGSVTANATYPLSESGPSGYAIAIDWQCTITPATGAQTATGVFTAANPAADPPTPATIMLGAGESATCTITNDDIAPKLHLRKTVINDNGGIKTVADFTLTADGTGSNDLSGTSPVDGGAGLIADTWALSETSVYGYSASLWSCVGGTQNGSNITVGIGGEATCTITNDDQPGTIVIIKNAKPAQGSFAFTTTGTGYSGFTLTGATAGGGNQNSQTLDAGTYTANEGTQLGWILTGIGGSTDPNTPYNCTVTGSGGSTGVGDLNTQTVTISLQNGDVVTCVFENTGQGVTRTQGFWATHSVLANIAWFGGTAFGHTFPGVANLVGIGDITLCGRPLDQLGEVMGAFWSGIPKTSTGAKRSSLDQARMQLLQQLIAAELNASAFGSAPSSGSFAGWETALCGTDQTAIKTAQQQAASFNSAGDNSTFTPGTSADSKVARSVANIPFWDIIKP